MNRKPIPSIVEAFEGQQRIAVEKILRMVEDEDIVRYKGVAEDLLAETDSVTLLSAALKLLTKSTDTNVPQITEEAPMRGKKTGGQGQGFGPRRQTGQQVNRPFGDRVKGGPRKSSSRTSPHPKG